MIIGTTWTDYPTREDIAVIAYCRGCTHCCLGCHNQDLQIFTHEHHPMPIEIVDTIALTAHRNRTNKVVLSGGDPLHPLNIARTRSLLSLLPKLHFCIYTGYNIEYVKSCELLEFDFVKCGRFEIGNRRTSYKNDTEMAFASTNQCLYNGQYKLISEGHVYHFV